MIRRTARAATFDLRLQAGVDVGSARHVMADIALVFQPLENRARGRFLHEVLFLERKTDVF